MNMDGETNLKIKKCPDVTAAYTRETVGPFKATIQYEVGRHPTADRVEGRVRHVGAGFVTKVLLFRVGD